MLEDPISSGAASETSTGQQNAPAVEGVTNKQQSSSLCRDSFTLKGGERADTALWVSLSLSLSSTLNLQLGLDSLKTI